MKDIMTIIQKIPPVDIAGAVNRAMGDTELIQVLFDDFNSTVDVHSENIETAATANDMAILAREAHQLKGAAGSMCVTGIAIIALALERMGKGEIYFDTKAVDLLQKEVRRFHDYMDHYTWDRA